MDYCNLGKDDYSDLQDRALGAHCVRYKWCAYELCKCALNSLIFSLNTAQYIHVAEYSEYL